MAGKPNAPCGLLPIPLLRCPCCGEGVKPSRSWTWVDGDRLVGTPVDHGSESHTRRCPFGRGIGDRVGLLWIGGAFYDRPETFMAEARRMGISRRVSALPRDYDPDNPPWVLLAHREGMTCTECPPGDKECATCDGTRLIPAVFSLFKPERVEYVVHGHEEQDELDRLRKRGIEPVKVVRDFEQGGMDV